MSRNLSQKHTGPKVFLEGGGEREEVYEMNVKCSIGITRLKRSTPEAVNESHGGGARRRALGMRWDGTWEGHDNKNGDDEE